MCRLWVLVCLPFSEKADESMKNIMCRSKETKKRHSFVFIIMLFLKNNIFDVQPPSYIFFLVC